MLVLDWRIFARRVKEALPLVVVRMTFENSALVPVFGGARVHIQSRRYFVKSEHAFRAHAAEMVFEPVPVPEFIYFEAGEKVPLVGAHPLLVENAGHLAVSVVIEKSVDFLQNGVIGPAELPGGEGHGHHKSACGPALKSDMSR